jgi:SNF2 family DNA or RNA helicase
VNRLADSLSSPSLIQTKRFKDRISTPIQKSRGGVAMKRLHVVLKVILLRRTKNDEVDGKALVNLPKRTVMVEKLEWDDE